MEERVYEMAGIKLIGMDKLEKRLKKNVTLDDVKKVVRKNGSDLQRSVQRHADFKKGYQTGTTKRSVGLEIVDGGMTAMSGPTTEYSEYLEYGTRFMKKQPFVKPALEEVEKGFKSDMGKLVR